VCHGKINLHMAAILFTNFTIFSIIIEVGTLLSCLTPNMTGLVNDPRTSSQK